MLGQELTIQDHDGKIIILTREDTALRIKLGAKSPISIPYRQILNSTFKDDKSLLTLAYLHRKKQTGPFTLIKLQGIQQKPNTDFVAQWVESLMTHIYEDSGVQRRRRLKILVNPHGGVRKGASIFVKTVEPIFLAAQCQLDIIYTKHQGHAFEIAKDLPLNYDVVVTVAGDGLIHEVMNGFAHHENPKKAFGIPISPIPTGSGNGLSLNLLGPERGFDVTEAALNVIKGKHMKVDVFSLTQGDKRTISFMSQALGLMADLDIGTENLRWMGDTRFTVGLLRGVLQFKPCPVQLSYKIAESDKTKMANDVRELQAQRKSIPQSSTHPVESGGLPPLMYLPDDRDGWTTYDQPILYIYAGKGPFVGRDYMAFPVSQPDDGLIDVMAQPLSSRTEILSSMGGAAKGEIYWQQSLHYVKAHAYRVTPLATKGALAVDGEIFPFKEFQVEVHQKLATLLSPYGYYAADFPSQQPSVRKPSGNKEVHGMPKLSRYELEREANIARNRALLEQLELKQAVAGLGISPSASKPEKKAQLVQPKKRVKKETAHVEAPRRQSSRLKRAAIDLDESPSKRQKREAELEVLRAQEAEARLEAEERARIANRPRRHDLDIATLIGEEDLGDIPLLTSILQDVLKTSHSRRVAEPEAFTGGDKREEADVADLRERLQALKIVSRAKVTQDRVYSAAYHPEITKDLLFFGDKHGQLGIWDARAPPEDMADEDGETVTDENAEGGKYWRLQVHWPATSKSSISCVKMDPINSHRVYTSSYDCSVRSLSFETGISQQVYATEDGALISSIDLMPTGNEMWISDSLGGVTHIDMRESKHKTRWYGLSEQKIGCLSLNPARPNFLLTASNNRLLKVWDTRKLAAIGVELSDAATQSTGLEFGTETMNKWIGTTPGKGSCGRYHPRDSRVPGPSHLHDHLVNYRTIAKRTASAAHTAKCQGKWLTILKAQWSPNPDVYPHFTGNLVARLSDKEKISAVQAVTCSHPNIVERAASGNASGRCVLWAIPTE
ncbi:hypothetical protein H0H92_010967 [Tricholoma furcatifolium]|nr:hypothetical protein H0H92_010967 [Tricholoma furcatifolium]